MLNGVSPHTISMVTRSVEQTYKRFVHFVGENRKMNFDQVDAIGGGRVWTGKRAKEIGLVDELGSMSDAIKFAASKAGVKDYATESYPKKKDKFAEIISLFSSEDVEARWMKNKLGAENYKLYEKLLLNKNKSQIIMETPYSVSLK
jgi:protease-4